MLNTLSCDKNTPTNILYEIYKDGDHRRQEAINKICQDRFNNETIYLDYNDDVITRSQLQKEYNELKQSGEVEDETFDDYELNSTTGNGNLRKFNYKKRNHK